MSFLAHLRKRHHCSERAMSVKLGMARETLRHCEQNMMEAKGRHLQQIAQMLDHTLLLEVVPVTAAISELSIAVLSMKVQQDGFSSWKIHFFNFVDEFRRCPDVRLILLPPVDSLDERLKALLASIVAALCEEVSLDAPNWTKQEVFLSAPWFVAGMDSLKASAMIESPLAFRRNNIFVLENFLKRA